ncbi:MAG: hypothetical protein EHM62_06795 [Methylococcus sp.]|nr:MAG: hypothetical protein EHM62_06795 [Methylococcus sp.]
MRSFPSKFLLTTFLVLLALAFAPLPARAITVEGVTFAREVRIGDATVPLRNAALLRYLYFLKAYVAALYLPADVAPERALADVPKRLEISYLVAIRGEDFDKGAAPVLRRNLSPTELERLQQRLDRLNAAYRDVQPGDRYALSYHPGRGTELNLNGTPLVTIEGADFAAAYFGIWLGREPIDEGLKRSLLKGPEAR